MIKKQFALLFLILLLLLLACNSHFRNSIVPKQIDKNDWTLENTPNNLDVVGVIFGVEANGSLIRIPGGRLDIKTVQSPVVLTESKSTKNVSYGALVNFLNLNRYIDSTTNVGFQDTTKLESVFLLKSGTITNINDDIASAFEKQKPLIISNVSTLNLDSTKFFLVLETIQSPNVDISFNKSKSTTFAIYSKLQKLLNFNTNIHVSRDNNNQLTYELQEPLVVFYKLKRINKTISRIKGSPLKKVELSLGDNVTSDELPIR